MPAVRQGSTSVISNCKGNQNHPNLTHPDMEGTSEILCQKACADDLENHHYESPEENQCRSCSVSHSGENNGGFPQGQTGQQFSMRLWMGIGAGDLRLHPNMVDWP